MSSTFQTVVRGPNFTGCGKRPILTPAHQVERPIGIGPCGARIDASRTKPVGGKVVLALLYNFVCRVEFFHFNPIRLSDGAGGDLPLEIVAAAARVEPLRIERGLTPARVALLAGFATLFLPCGEIQAKSHPHQHVAKVRLASQGRGCVVPRLLSQHPKFE